MKFGCGARSFSRPALTEGKEGLHDEQSNPACLGSAPRGGGPTAVEYAILLAMIAIGVMVSFASLGDKMDAIYMTIFTAVDAAFAG